jgi:hypothetical protein
MRIKKDDIVEKLKEKIEEWDANLERFRLKGYPMRLMAQIQYRKKMKVLVATRLLVEQTLRRFKKKKSAELSKQ